MITMNYTSKLLKNASSPFRRKRDRYFSNNHIIILVSNSQSSLLSDMHDVAGLLLYEVDNKKLCFEFNRDAIKNKQSFSLYEEDNLTSRKAIDDRQKFEQENEEYLFNIYSSVSDANVCQILLKTDSTKIKYVDDRRVLFNVNIAQSKCIYNGNQRDGLDNKIKAIIFKIATCLCKLIFTIE
ncbi:hypothetical protein GJ496_009219 [Pomphorhynchus laevis]|nr:hypothetical protein GJ496_009219 [Pomphorhynchus laevis]